jgi:hypothetical protein
MLNLDSESVLKTLKRKQYEKQWRIENKDRVELCAKKYKAKHSEFFRKYHKDYNKKWQKENKEKIRLRKAAYYKENKKRIIETGNKYRRERMTKDINYKLRILLRNRVRFATKSNAKAGSAVKDLGCTIEYFKKYIEDQFESGMNWNNWGIKDNQWSIDHIKQLYRFDLTKRDHFLEACHYTNQRPMWHKDNVARGKGIENE